MTTVIKIRPIGDGWEITAKKTGSVFESDTKFFAKELIVSAGTFNTQKLLHRMKDKKILPQLSERLGDFSRTNSESLVGAIMPNLDIDFSKGSAITSSFFPDERTHIEPVRYGKGSNFMGLLQTMMTDGQSPKLRRKQWRRLLMKKPSMFFHILNVRNWSERTVIALVMQNVDSWIKVRGKRGIFGWKLTSKNSEDHPNAIWIPAANAAVRHIADRYDGIPGGNIGELIGAPFTAHFVGGCIIGDSSAAGVIDPYQRVWNYPSLHIIDGSTITANLGVNPSLTITAQAERALSMWPNRGEEDPRPVKGARYKRIAPVTPNKPVVPIGAPAELRFSPPPK
jgi:cholesterol oxidase